MICFRRVPALTGLLTFVVAAFVTARSDGQIRIVAYNTETAFTTNGNPNPGLQTVLQGIGNETVNGFAKRADILVLSEQNNSTGTTTAQILAMMNTLYGANTYAKSSLIADATFQPNTDSPAVVYDQTKFQLVNEVAVGTVSGSGMPRQEIRYQFRPIGYSSTSDFYIYGVHYKASGSSSDMNRRNIEAQTMRANAGTLPAGSRIIYAGDFNLTDGTSEAAWTTITSSSPSAQTAGIDPKAGSWANANLTWSTTNLGSRLDFQFQTPPTNDGRGFSIINGSYHAYSNNGTIPSGGQSPISSVRTASDHYPVVADYRYPARMNVSVGSVPSQVIVGASVPVNVTVTNTAPVQAAIGADGLDYSVSGFGAVSGSGSGTALMALSPGQNHVLSLSTASAGTSSGSLTVNSTSQEVANGFYSQTVSTEVLDHSQPSFSGTANVAVATIDFGIHGRNLGGATSSFSIFNREGNGPTAALDLDSVQGSGSTVQLTTDATAFGNLSAGANQGFTANLAATSNGALNATYTFNLSDEDLPGEATRGPLTLVLKGIVATPGDADLNGIINFDDYSHIDSGFNQGLNGWGNGDFDGNGIVNFDDYALIDFYFNQQGGGLLRALSYVGGDDRSDRGMDSASLQAVKSHFEQFGESYASAFISAVPEPGVIAWVGVGLMVLRRRRNFR